MLKTFVDKIKSLFGESTKTEMGCQYEDDHKPSWKGEVFFEIRDGESGELIEERHMENIITKDMSILLAWLANPDTDPSRPIAALAVGTGDPTWQLAAGDTPPPPEEDQRSLHSEIERKHFQEVHFVGPEGTVDEGDHVNYPTHIVDFTTKFDVSEASGGALVEMGLIGNWVPGSPENEIDTTTNYDPTINVEEEEHDILCNYLTFKPINKPTSAVMKISWRISF